MFAQMRTLSTNYYHVWAGFEDASFLGYYQNGINTNLVPWDLTTPSLQLSSIPLTPPILLLPPTRP